MSMSVAHCDFTWKDGICSVARFQTLPSRLRTCRCSGGGRSEKATYTSVLLPWELTWLRDTNSENSASLQTNHHPHSLTRRWFWRVSWKIWNYSTTNFTLAEMWRVAFPNMFSHDPICLPNNPCFKVQFQPSAYTCRKPLIKCDCLFNTSSFKGLFIYLLTRTPDVTLGSSCTRPGRDLLVRKGQQQRTWRAP